MQSSILIQVLQEPTIVKSFKASDWNLLMRQAICAKMLTRLNYYFKTFNLIKAVPEKILNHINSEQVKVSHLHVQVKQEVDELNRLFNHLDIKAIYLKGAAYLLADLPLAQGRTFSDIDILLAKDDISKVEISLKCQGWKSQKTDDHDQAYYRDYMHEIPPMQHILRGTVIDIHHNILPICNSNIIDISLLSSGALKLDKNNSYILSPAAMFLHSAIHLFHEGELEQGLRGLSDLDLMFHHFSETEKNFSQQLIDLACKTNQERSLFYTWHYLIQIFDRDLPKSAQDFLKGCQQKYDNLATIDFIYTNLFNAHHSTTTSWKFFIAKYLAFWRGHLLRMPLKLLVPHLLRKSWLQLIHLFKKDPVTINKVDALNPRFKEIDKD